MKAKKLLLLFLLSTSMTGFAITKIVSTIDNTFSPMNLVIAPGDVVEFHLDSGHNVLEVDQDHYNSETNPGTQIGFKINFGIAVGTLTDLTLGPHWYICEAHIMDGMKGTITVTALGVNDFQLAKRFSVFPNPANEFTNIKASQNAFDLPYVIMDAGGRQVSIGKLNDVTTLIDLSQITSGIYFLQIGEDRRQTFKLIKK